MENFLTDAKLKPATSATWPMVASESMVMSERKRDGGFKLLIVSSITCSSFFVFSFSLLTDNFGRFQHADDWRRRVAQKVDFTVLQSANDG